MGGQPPLSLTFCTDRTGYLESTIKRTILPRVLTKFFWEPFHRFKCTAEFDKQKVLTRCFWEPLHRFKCTAEFDKQNKRGIPGIIRNL